MPQQYAKPNQQEQNKVLDDSMQKALNKVLTEMPDVRRVSVSPSTSSLLTRFLMPKSSMAVTNPFTGNITYNPEMFGGQSQNDIENTLAHELTHVRQTQDTPWYKIVGDMFTPDSNAPQGLSKNSPMNNPYYWRPNELEAFQTEKNRTLNKNLPYMSDPILGTRDIPLFRPRKKSGIDTGPRSK